MIANETELSVTLKRIERLQLQIAEIRRTEHNPQNYRASVSGFVSEIDRLQLEVREYLMTCPNEAVGAA
jgi:hypothetical protein